MHTAPKLHNAMWPGLVGKGDGEGQEPAIGLDRMLELTAAANVNGQKFDGIDYFLFHPHTDPDASVDDLKRMADKIAAKGLVRTFQKTSVFGGRSALENVMIGLHLRSRQTTLAILLGLPGNPVSTMVCSLMFMAPAMRRMLGLPDQPPRRITASSGNRRSPPVRGFSQ